MKLLFTYFMLLFSFSTFASTTHLSLGLYRCSSNEYKYEVTKAPFYVLKSDAEILSIGGFSTGIVTFNKQNDQKFTICKNNVNSKTICAYIEVQDDMHFVFSNDLSSVKAICEFKQGI